MTHSPHTINGAITDGPSTERGRPWLSPTVRLAGRRLLDLVLPPHCLKCGVIVGEPGSLCTPCWEGMTFITRPHCAQCGIPFTFAAEIGAVCGACIRRPPLYLRARAVFVYDDNSRDLVLGFKHADRTEAAPAFGRWMARAGAEILADAELIVPVPLHWTRLWRRRFNQSALLAKALAAETGITMIPDLLIRRRRTPSQGGLGPAGRVRNVRGAFAINPRQRGKLAGRRVVLVDDVHTTGATLEACTRVLLRAGAGSVDALTLARVPRPKY